MPDTTDKPPVPLPQARQIVDRVRAVKHALKDPA